MKNLIFTTLLLVFGTLYGEEMSWPELNDIPHVAGRVATEEDINAGAAVFMLQSEGINIGTPIEIEIPQYALHKDEEGKISKVIVIQAESANDQEVIGAVSIADGSFMVGLKHEFDFKGKQKTSE